MSDPVQEKGLFASLGRVAATLFELAQVRLDLLGTEVELEKRRLFDGLLWGAVSVLLVGLGLVLLCGFVILLFWEGYRLPAVGVMALSCLGGGVFAMRLAQQRLQNSTGMFNASLAELEKDRVALQGAGHE